MTKPKRSRKPKRQFAYKHPDVGLLGAKARRRIASHSILKSWKDDRLPIVDWFKGNPVGVLISIFLFFLVIYMWTQNLPTNPYFGATGPNGGSFVSQWSLFFNNTKWILTLALPFFGFAIAYYAIEQSSRSSGVPGGEEAASLFRRIRSSTKIRGLGKITGEQSSTPGPKTPTIMLPQISTQRMLPEGPTVQLGKGKVIDAEFKES